MAITKEVIEDKIEIVGEHKIIQVRTSTIVKEDGNEISRSSHRKCLDSIQTAYDGTTFTHTDTDISGESAQVQGIANLVWTDAVKASKKSANELALS